MYDDTVTDRPRGFGIDTRTKFARQGGKRGWGIDDVTTLLHLHGRWPDVWTTVATAACCTADELQPIENRRM